MLLTTNKSKCEHIGKTLTFNFGDDENPMLLTGLVLFLDLQDKETGLFIVTRDAPSIMVNNVLMDLPSLNKDDVQKFTILGENETEKTI